MSATEVTPLMRGRGSDPRVPTEEEEGGARSRGSQAHRPRIWTSDRAILTLLGFGMAFAAAFISTTQTIERFRQPSQQQHEQQQQGGGGGGGGGGGVASSLNSLARTVHEENGEPSARLGMSPGGEGLVAAQQPRQDSMSPPSDAASSSTTNTPAAAAAAAGGGAGGGAAAVAAAAAAAAGGGGGGGTAGATAIPSVNAPTSGSNGESAHGFRSEDQTAAVDSEGGVADGFSRGEAHGIGAALSDGLAARAEGGWRLNGINKNSGFAGAVEGGRLGGFGGSGPSVSAEAGSDRKPNVFFILTDDMGYGDIGYQSTDLSLLTPNLDALMSGGRKLSNYYSMPLCSPARASLMTGRYPVRYGMQYSIISPGEPWGLSLSEKVLPEYMNEAGYESHMVGKWHLGSYNDESVPFRRGFTTFLGYLGGEQTYYTHVDMDTMENGVGFYDFGFGNETGYYDVTKTKDGVPCSELESSERAAWKEVKGTIRDPADVCYIGTYSTDAFIGRAQNVIKEKTPWDEEPLFLYLAHQSVHSPLGPAPTEEFTNEEKSLLRAVSDGTTSATRTQFAGVVLYLDKKIGELMDLLEAEGWLENSIIVVASDNGGCPSGGGCNYPLRGTKGSMFEAGTKVPGLIWSKSHLPESLWGTSYDHMMHVTDWLPTLMSAVGGELAGSAGALDGVDHWDSLTSVAVEGTGSSREGPRTEMLYNWDAYELSSADTVTENLDLVQGAFRQGSWKLLVNVWCEGYYSFDKNVVNSDPNLDPAVTCQKTLECSVCGGSCVGDPNYRYGDFLVNLDDDPFEAHNLLEHFPEIAARLRERAEEVVFSEYTKSAYAPANPETYEFWKAHDWWIIPWFGKLASDLPEHGGE